MQSGVFYSSHRANAWFVARGRKQLAALQLKGEDSCKPMWPVVANSPLWVQVVKSDHHFANTVLRLLRDALRSDVDSDRKYLPRGKDRWLEHLVSFESGVKQ